MLSSVLSPKTSAILAIAGLLLAGTFMLGGGHRATSSPPPLKMESSGLLLRTASQEQLDVLTTGLRSGLNVASAYAIKSTRHGRAWYVGARLEDGGRDEGVAVWLITGPKAHPIHPYSVDREAQDASVWPAGEKSRASTSPIDQEALALRRALRPQ